MRRIILGLSILAIAGATTFTACKKGEEKKTTQQNSSNKNETNFRAVTTSSYYNSFGTQKLGVDSIKYLSTNNGEEMFNIFSSVRNINGIIINLNLSNFTVKVVGNIITINVNMESTQQSFEYRLNSDTKEMFDVTNNILVTDEYFEDNYKGTMIGVALSLYDATFNPYPIQPAYLPSGGGGCNYTMMSFRRSRSKATALVTAAAAAYCASHPGCSTIYGVDAYCIFGDYACVATQEIHCTSGC